MASLASLGSYPAFTQKYSEEELKMAAWRNATFVSDGVSIDCDGCHMVWHQHGEYSEFGWQVDHIIPKALGGPDIPSNVRARHWRGNSSAGGVIGALLNKRR